MKDNLRKSDRVLEIGAGYGRIVAEIADSYAEIIGIDISEGNVRLSCKYLSGIENANLIFMDAHF